MIYINDPYDLVPELFRNWSEYQRSSQASIDVLPMVCPESFQSSERFTVWIQPEPTMDSAAELYIRQRQARPRHQFAVSGWCDECQWSVPWNLYLANLTMTVRVNPGIAAVESGIKPFVATALMGGWSIARAHLVLELQHLGIAEQCLIHYHERSVMSPEQREFWLANHTEACFSYRSPELDKLDHPVFLDVAFRKQVCDPQQSIPLNTCQPIPGMRAYQHGWISQLIPRNIYSAAELSIVAETECLACYQSFFLSEKLAKPLIIGHPFVVLGCQHYLKRLQSLGIQTFSSWIDESYDSEPDTYQRARAIARSVAEFARLPSTQREAALIAMYEVAQHNRRTVLDPEWQHSGLIKAISQALV